MSCMRARGPTRLWRTCAGIWGLGAFLALALAACPLPGQASEWFVADDIIGGQTLAGFDQNNNLYYYSNLFNELRIRTPSGVLSKQIGFAQPPFSTTGYNPQNLDVRDMAVASDGTAYLLIADNSGSLNTSIKVVGLQADHATAVLWQLTWANLQSVRPTQIAVDANGNLFVLEANFLVYQGQQTTVITTVTVKKYDPNGQLLWSRPIDFSALFPSLVLQTDNFPPLLYSNRSGSQLYIVNQGRLWIDKANGIRSPQNLLIAGVNGASGAIQFSQRIGDLVDPANATVDDLSILGGFFTGPPRNGDVDSSGNLLLIGSDTRYVNGAGPGQGGASGQYWLFMDKTGAIRWQRKVGQALPAALAGIEPDFVPAAIQSAGQTLTPDGLLGVHALAFGPQDNLFLTGEQNVTVTSGGATLQAAEAYAAKYNLTTGKQWKALVAAPVSPAPDSGNQVQAVFLTPEVDGAGNVYMGSGIYADTNFIFHRFIEKNPQISPELQVSVNAGLSAQTLTAGSGADPALLKHIPVLSLNMKAILGDYTVDSLTVSSRGNGDEVNDIATVRLKIGNTVVQTLPGSAFAAGATSTAPYTITFTGLNHTIASGSTETWVVEYDFQPTACAYTDGFSALGTLYVAQLDAGKFPVNLISAQSSSTVTVTSGEGPEIRIQEGSLGIDLGTDNQSGAKSSILPQPLRTQIIDQSGDAHCQVKVQYSISSKPAHATGQSLNPGIATAAKGANVDTAESSLTLGDQAGTYSVDAQLFIPQRDNHGAAITAGGGSGTITPTPRSGGTTIPGYFSAGTPVTFTATAQGVNILAAAHNGNPNAPRTFGTFIPNIPATNTFTANVVPASGVNNVTFDVGGVSVAGTASGSQYVSGGLDMSTLAAGLGNTLTVTANTANGAFTETANLKAIAFPAWVPALQSLATNFVTEFQPANERYHIGFSWPVNFAWSRAVDTAVLLLGGEQNDANLQFNANAYYYLTEASGFDAAGSYTAKVLGHDLNLNATLSGGFDANFAFTGGNGTLKSSTSFSLPDKSASKTVVVYGVPVTAALEIGGGGNVLLDGAATLDNNLAFSELLIVPGINVTLEATASLAALFGAAKLGVNASPLTELQLRLLYTSLAGLSPTFGGRLTVPIKVFGSLFWGLAGGTLASTQLGPYTFGSFAGVPLVYNPANAQALTPAMKAALAMAAAPGITVPEFFPSGDIAIAPNDARMVVFTVDVDPAVGSVSPDVYYRIFSGGSWSAAAPIVSEPNLWEMDPTVTWLGNGKALALWTSNDGPKTLNNLNDIFAAQDIRYAVWNGTAWSVPGYVINDAEADGVADACFDGASNQALAVWFHDANTDRDINTRTQWDVYSATYDAAAGAWSAPMPLAGADSAADFMPRVACTAGKAMAVWAHDADGQFFTVLPQVTNGTNVSYANTDGSIYYAVRVGGAWSAPLEIPGSNTGEAVSGPAVAWSPAGDQAVVAWIGKKNSTTHLGATDTILHYAVYSAVTASWTPPAVIRQGSGMEDVQVLIDANGAATILWRGTGIDKNGGIFATTLNLASNTLGTITQQVAPDKANVVNMGLSSAMDSSGKVYSIWRRNDFTSGADQSSPGLTGNLVSGGFHPGSASFSGYFSDTALDGNGDGKFDELRWSIGINVATAGDYSVRGALYDGSGAQIGVASVDARGLAAGASAVYLSFAGAAIADHGVDGPYTLGDITLYDLNNGGVVTDSYPQTITSQAYQASAFAGGFISFDRPAYDGARFTSASISVSDATANTDPFSAQTINVQVASTSDATGFGITLTETGVNTGVFQGTLTFNTTASNAATASLLVADGDTVTASYQRGATTQNATAQWTQASAVTLDVDGSGASDANDGVMILRRLNGAQTVTTGIVLPTGASNASVVNAIANAGTGLDVDGDGDTDANDGVMILRRLNAAQTVTTGIVLPANVGGAGANGERSNAEVVSAIDGMK